MIYNASAAKEKTTQTRLQAEQLPTVADSCRQISCQNTVLICYRKQSQKSEKAVETQGFKAIFGKCLALTLPGLANRRIRPSAFALRATADKCAGPVARRDGRVARATQEL